jgi:hypothetical protein
MRRALRFYCFVSLPYLPMASPPCLSRSPITGILTRITSQAASIVGTLDYLQLNAAMSEPASDPAMV